MRLSERIREKMRVVMCRGVFDLLHIAHLRHLREARGMGDSLHVSLTSDDTAEREKRRPVTPQAERAEMLVGLGCVTYVTIDDDYREALKKWRPVIYCKGSDHTMLPEEFTLCADLGIEVRQTKPNPQHTSTIIERLKACA